MLWGPRTKDPMSYNVSAICGRLRGTLDNDFKVY